jgi:hypothetical protein
MNPHRLVSEQSDPDNIRYLREWHPDYHALTGNPTRLATELARTFHRDLVTVFEALAEEAKERSWCADYVEFVKNLNDQLFFQAPLPEVTEQFEFLVRVNVTAPSNVMASTVEMYRDFLYHNCDNPSSVVGTYGCDVVVDGVATLRNTHDE